MVVAGRHVCVEPNKSDMLSTILLFLGGVITAYFTYRAAVEVARINADSDYRKAVDVASITSEGDYRKSVMLARVAAAGGAQVPEVPRKRRISLPGTPSKELGRGSVG